MISNEKLRDKEKIDLKSFKNRSKSIDRYKLNKSSRTSSDDRSINSKKSISLIKENDKDRNLSKHNTKKSKSHSRSISLSYNIDFNQKLIKMEKSDNYLINSKKDRLKFESSKVKHCKSSKNIKSLEYLEEKLKLGENLENNAEHNKRRSKLGKSSECGANCDTEEKRFKDLKYNENRLKYNLKKRHSRSLSRTYNKNPSSLKISSKDTIKNKRYSHNDSQNEKVKSSRHNRNRSGSSKSDFNKSIDKTLSKIDKSVKELRRQKSSKRMSCTTSSNVSSSNHKDSSKLRESSHIKEIQYVRKKSRKDSISSNRLQLSSIKKFEKEKLKDIKRLSSRSASFKRRKSPSLSNENLKINISNSKRTKLYNRSSSKSSLYSTSVKGLCKKRKRESFSSHSRSSNSLKKEKMSKHKSRSNSTSRSSTRSSEDSSLKGKNLRLRKIFKESRRSRTSSRKSRSRSRKRYISRNIYRNHNKLQKGFVSLDSIQSGRRETDDRIHPEPNQCLGVFGLSKRTTEVDLYKIFDKYGYIEKLHLITDRYTNESRGYCFITYEKINSATKAKEDINGKNIDGKFVRIDYSITKKAHTPTPGVYKGRSSQRHGFKRSISRKSNRSRSRSYRRRSRS